MASGHGIYLKTGTLLYLCNIWQFWILQKRLGFVTQKVENSLFLSPI